MRQFVLTVPFELRARMAYDAAFASSVRRALHEAILAAYARRAHARGVCAGRTGGITAELTEHDPLGVASCLHRIALRPRRGQHVERIGVPKTLRGHDLELHPTRPKARYAGFDLEAGVRIPAYDRRALERLCRYLMRPPLAEKRLRFRDDGKVELELKSRWPDGTTHLRFTPLELVEKAAALVPRPHENLLVYFGVLAANAAMRPDVVAHGRPPDVTTGPDAVPSSRDASTPSARSRAPRDWATLMKRGLDLDVLTCPTCGDRLRLHALVDDPRLARPLAERLGLLRPRPGPADLPRSLAHDTRYEPDPDFVDPHDDN